MTMRQKNKAKKMQNDSDTHNKIVSPQEEQYRSLFNAIDQGFCIIEIIFDKNKSPVDYRFLEVNHVFEELTGIHQPIGRTIREITPSIESVWYTTLGNVVLTGKPVRFDNKSEALNRWFSIYGMQWGGPESNQVAVIFNNILPQKKAAELQTRLAAIIESSDDAIIGKNLNSIIMTWNRGAENIFGYKADEIIGKSIRTLIPPEMQDEEDTILAQLRQGKRIDHFETTRITKDGTSIDVSITISPIKDTEGKIIGASKIARDITQQKNIQRQKDDFMGIVSHELKTPVTSLKAFTQVLHHKFAKAGDVKSAALLNKMHTQINKLTKLIADLLDVTKIEAGKLQFNENFFEFDVLVDEVIAEIQLTTSQHHIQKKGSTQKSIYGDKDRIGQVIINMLTNAIKYSPDSKKIIVTLAHDEKTVTLSVQDFGIGIARDKQKQVFERFYRVGDAVTSSVPGIGLGMYISAEIIRRQHGRIWAESEKGKGSTFYFSLPIEKIAAKPKRLVE